MYLKRLELHGFKTFADRTELEFTPGITAVVGPNGSGKSNVFDAIRWALGEMSFRSLRSGRMDDFIFAGSTTRRAMGQAEISLTINNDSGALPVDYAEVTVTRRATRGGDGEYFLNDTACRLRDIQMLFLGTGLGGRSYSLIGQGQVDGVLNAAPEERRQLLEEAAGLARYKRRRREAERRLEHASANLLRVADLLGELTAQLEQLRVQAEAATAYQVHTKEIRDLELALQVDEARRVITGLKRISTQIETVQAQLRETAQTAATLGGQMDADRARAAETALAREDAQRTLLQVVEDLAGRESALQILQERVRTTTVQRERLAADLQRLQARQAQVDQALGMLREQAEMMGSRRDDLLEQLRLAEEAHSAGLQSQQQADARLAALRAELVDLVAARTEATRDLAKLDARLAALDEQAAMVRQKETALAAEVEHLGATVADAAAKLETLRRAHDEAAAGLAERRQRGEALDAVLASLETDLRRLAAERQVTASTLSLLEDLHRQLAGYEQGVREILLAKRDDPERFPGIRYPVAELIRVKPEHRPAIEAALGRRLFSLIAGTLDDVKGGLAYLRGNGRGSASFLPLDLLHVRPAAAVPSGGQIVGRAPDLVELTNGAKDVVETLLGDVVIVASLDAAVALRRAGYAGRIATLEGELVSPDGVVSVRGRATGDGVLLGRGEQIQHLRAQQAALDTRAAGLETRQDEALIRRRALDAEIAAAEDALARCEAEMAAGQMRAQLARADLDRLPLQQQELDAAQARLAEERRGIEADAGRLRGDAAEISEAIAAREAEVTEVEAALRQVDAGAHAASMQMTDVRVQLAELAGTLDAVQARIDEHVTEGGDLLTRCNQLQGEITVFDGERHLLTHSVEEAQQARHALVDLQAATRERLADLESERGMLQQRMMDAEAQWRRLQESLREVEDQAHRLEVRHAQVEAELAAVQRRISEEFGIGWDAVREIRLPSGRDEAAGRIEALRGLVAALGPVNLLAVEEHQTLRTRVEALRAQADDLERAKAALAALIQRIEEILRVRFADTFAAVNEEFNRLFVRLFAGGQAALRLVEGEPGTEPGVEIEAQLPGKKMRSLSAFSGGERVLVALSLIFAMLRVHPSPFCIFDEVEAALDDVNTKKFTTLLRELADRTQILIITHNKGTMEAADVLYGVTMETPGVSTIISMRLTGKKESPEPAVVA